VLAKNYSFIFTTALHTIVVLYQRFLVPILRTIESRLNPEPRGEILSHPENNVPQAIVYSAIKKSGVYCVRNSGAMVLFLSNEYLDRNLTFFFRCFPHNLSPISLLRNTMACGTLFSGGLRISPQFCRKYHSGFGLKLRFQ
jgi:hypothetical protein